MHDDRIERQIEIAAPASRVWELVTVPGWYINDGAVIEHRVEKRPDPRGDLVVVHDPVHGEFPILTVRLDPPRYAAFRWLAQADADAVEVPSTLVEFWIDELPDGGVLLRVAESGFESLGRSEVDRRRMVEENTRGWEEELAAARAFLDPVSVQRSVWIDSPPADVWPAVTTAEHLAAWHAFDGVSMDARPGGVIEFRWAEHGAYRATVTAVDEPKVFAYRVAARPDTDPAEGNSTHVTFTLTVSGRGTLLTVAQTGFDRLAPEFGPAEVNAATEAEGWSGGFAALARHLGNSPAQ